MLEVRLPNVTENAPQVHVIAGAAFRSLWTCFPRAHAEGPLHSDAMGAAE